MGGNVLTYLLLRLAAAAVVLTAAGLGIYLFLREFSIVRKVHWPHIHFSFALKNFKLSSNTALFFKIALMVVLTRIIVLIIAYWGFRCFGDAQGGFFELFDTFWNRYDTVRYLQIAKDGYLASGNPHEVVNLVFLPLYPLLVRLFSFLTGGNLLWSGTIVSLAGSIFACYYLYRLALLDFSHTVAERAVKYLLIYPFSLFLTAAYTESVFLAVSLLCFWAARKKRFALSGLFAMLGALCKVQGILLMIPLAYEILLDLRARTLHNPDSAGGSAKPRLFKPAYLACLLPLAGYGIYLLINYFVAGNAFQYMNYQREYWFSGFGLFSQSIANTYAEMAQPSMRNIVNWGPQLAMFFVSFGLLFAATKKLRTSYLLYSFVYITVSYCTARLLSGPRYIIGAFPVFLAAALLLTNRNADRLVTLFCIMFYTLLLICFTFEMHVL